MGGFREWHNTWDTLIGKNVYMDTSVCYPCFLDESDFLRMIKAHGADKILFASDNPMMEPEYPLAQILKFNLTGKEKEAILYKNALSILEDK